MKYVIAILLVLLLSGCNNAPDSPETLAGEACACVKNQMFSLMSGATSENELPECARDVIKKIRAAINDRDEVQRSEYVRTLLIAALETECAIILFKLAPVEQMLREYLPYGISEED